MKLQSLSSNIDGNLLDQIEVPYVVEDTVLMSPGVWNDKFYDSDALESGFEKTDFSDEDVVSLFLDHEDEKAAKWIGKVKNIEKEGNDIKGDLWITDLQTALNLEAGANFGISPRLQVEENGGVINDMMFENFSVVFNPAVKTAYINNREVVAENQNQESQKEVKIMADEDTESDNELLEQVLERLEEIEQKAEENKSDMDKVKEQAGKIADILEISADEVMKALSPVLDSDKYPEPKDMDEDDVVVNKDELKDVVSEVVEEKLQDDEDDEPEEDEEEDELDEESEEDSEEESEEDSEDESEDESEEDDLEEDDEDEDLEEDDNEEEGDEELSEMEEVKDEIEKLKEEKEKLKEKLDEADPKSVKASESNEDVDSNKAMLKALGGDL